ncbi:MAG: (d)CMP kinase [Alphaproteobacteria bacterium]|nr:(d)CMP kinase [Alphaproteobacteria bacterium]
MPSTIIAIDGPSASGKGTIARMIAEELDYAYLDTGLLYRAVGMLAMSDGINLEDKAAIAAFAETLSVTAIINKLSAPALRSDEAATAASKVAPIPAVRAKLLKFQQDFGASPPEGKKGAVLDGRDIGTIIAPNAKVKIYVTADTAVRAQRRWKELQKRGETATYADVLADLRARDERDTKRSAAPALPATDAVILDNTRINAKETFAEAMKIVSKALATD